MAGFVFGQKENERRRKAYEQEMAEYADRQEAASAGATALGILSPFLAMIPGAGPALAAGAAGGSALTARYGAGDEPDGPNYVKEREVEIEPHQARTSRGNLHDPAGMSQGYEGQAAAQDPNDFRISALQGLKDKRRERNIGGLRR